MYIVALESKIGFFFCDNSVTKLNLDGLKWSFNPIINTLLFKMDMCVMKISVQKTAAVINT